jgi:hypothetical protein
MLLRYATIGLLAGILLRLPAANDQQVILVEHSPVEINHTLAHQIAAEPLLLDGDLRAPLGLLPEDVIDGAILGADTLLVLGQRNGTPLQFRIHISET